MIPGNYLQEGKDTNIVSRKEKKKRKIRKAIASVLRALRKLSDLCVNFFVFTDFLP
jgi:hypothetical protein